VQEVKCRCGAVVGWIQQINGVDFFTYGSGPVQSISLVCKECGSEFFWETNKKAFRRAMLRVFLEAAKQGLEVGE